VPRASFTGGEEAYTQHLHTVPGKAEDDLALPGLVRLDAGAAAGAAAGATAVQGAADSRFLPRSRRLSLTVRRVRYKWEMV